jgi:putative DNA primase/helicase
MITLRTLQRVLGGEINGGQLLTSGPGHSARDRSLAVRPDGNGGFTVYSHAGDDWRDCRDYVRARLGWPQWRPGDGRDRRVDPSRLAAFDRAAVDAESERRERSEWLRIKRARALWAEAVHLGGTMAEPYLRSRRLELDSRVTGGSVLRFHSACPWRDENTGRTVFIPCMLAAFTSIDDGEITAIHRVRVDQPQRWPKTERRMLGVVHRAAVKLDAAGSALVVGEGVETCLAARQLGHKPAWALGSARAIAHLPVLEGVERLRILGEAGKASADAVQLVGRRWHRAGRRVQVVTSSVGSDLNDELMAATA